MRNRGGADVGDEVAIAVTTRRAWVVGTLILKWATPGVRRIGGRASLSDRENRSFEYGPAGLTARDRNRSAPVPLPLG